MAGIRWLGLDGLVDQIVIHTIFVKPNYGKFGVILALDSIFKCVSTVQNQYTYVEIFKVGT